MAVFRGFKKSHSTFDFRRGWREREDIKCDHGSHGSLLRRKHSGKRGQEEIGQSALWPVRKTRDALRNSNLKNACIGFKQCSSTSELCLYTLKGF